MNNSSKLKRSPKRLPQVFDLDLNKSNEKAERLISIFKKHNIKEEFEGFRLENIRRSQRVITKFKEKNLHHFDIFRKVGFVADETNFSDAIASILDPMESHQLGIEPIMQLLNLLTIYDQEKINAFKKLVIDNKTKIVVQRERHEGKTIPDIELVCSDFVIFIENKVEGGSETITNDGWQTDRQWEALLSRCLGLNISEKNILAIFLTPEAKIPKNEHFLALSVPNLISAFKSAISSADTSSRHSLLAFLDYYSWA
jgi:hypothetical protein